MIRKQLLNQIRQLFISFSILHYATHTPLHKFDGYVYLKQLTVPEWGRLLAYMCGTVKPYFAIVLKLYSTYKGSFDEAD